MALDGREERARIMTTLGTLAGGRVWKTAVPDHIGIPRDEDGKVVPYLVVKFSRPFSSTQGRSIAGGEKAQPHIMTFTVIAYAGDADSAEELIAEVQLRLVDLMASDSSTPIRSTGGFSFGESETGSKPTRFYEAGWFRTTLNLSIPDAVAA
jgi:hypothetical protein